MSPLFARINPGERPRFLRDIYRLAAEKVLRETASTDARILPGDFEQAAEKNAVGPPLIEAALQNLTKARDLWLTNGGTEALRGRRNRHAIARR